MKHLFSGPGLTGEDPVDDFDPWETIEARFIAEGKFLRGPTETIQFATEPEKDYTEADFYSAKLRDFCQSHP
jgi:hypothetical protein